MKKVMMRKMLGLFCDKVVDVDVGLLQICQDLSGRRSLVMRLRLYLIVAVIDGLARQMT